MSERVQWWITTAWFEKGGQKVAGPFSSMAKAIEERKNRERAEPDAAYWIDHEDI